jgi:integrase
MLALDAADYFDGVLWVDKSIDPAGRIGPTKTGQHGPRVLLSQERLLLEEYLDGRTQGPMFYGTRQHGDPVRLPRQTLFKEWQRACATAGLENFHLHDLRRISLTLGLEAGLALKSTMARGAHTSVPTSLAYQDVSLEQARFDAARIDDARRSRQV